MEQKVTEIGILEYSESRYGGNFTMKKIIELFSESYEIDIRFDVFHSGIEGLTSEMVMAAKTCLDVINNHTDKLVQAIKSYYDTEVKEDVEGRGGNYITIGNVNQLAQVVTPKELFIQPLKTKILVGLYFICDWDEEAGMGIKFDIDGNICEIGTGEIIY